MSNDFRPKKFSDVVGNEVNNKILMAIAKNGGPSTILMSGSYGCGKTTCSRLFAKAINCSHLTNDICGECESCRSDFNNNPLYSEYDSSAVGNVEEIDRLYEDLTFVPKGKKRVINLDEAHLISRQAQSKLLKVFEDAPPNIYYVLSTTDKDSLLSTVLSRSLILNFNTKSKDEVISNLSKLAKERNINLSDGVVNLIALRSKGHMRDAHKLLEKYLLIGEKDFLNLEESSYNYIAKYFLNVLWLVKNSRSSTEEIKKHKCIMLEIVERIMRVPIALLKDDYQNFFFDLIKKSFSSDYVCEPIISKILDLYDSRIIMRLYKVAVDDFMMNSFGSDIKFQTALLSIYPRMLSEV